MAIFGLILLLAGLGGAGYGFFQKMQGKKLASAPFVPTGNVNSVSEADRKEISFEGAFVPGSEALLAPCSGTPCVYYELKVYQKWEEVEHTEDGEKKKTGRDLHEEKTLGAAFQVNDGSGPLTVYASEGKLKGGLEKTFSDSKGMSAGSVTWGEYTTHISQLPGAKYSKGIEIEEYCMKASPTMFVRGKVDPSKGGVTKMDGMLGGLHIYPKGREAILGKTASHAKYGFMGGGAGALIGTLMMVFGGPMAMSSGNGCGTLTDATEKACSTNVGKTGFTADWTVTMPGSFAISAKSTGKKYSTLPDIVVKDKLTGNVVASDHVGDIESTMFPAGSYTIELSDSLARSVKGGITVEMNISKDKSAVAAAPAAGAELSGLAVMTSDDLIKQFADDKAFQISAHKDTVAGPMTNTMVVAQRKKGVTAKTLNSITVMVMRPTSSASPLPQAMLDGTLSAMTGEAHTAALIKDGALMTVSTNLGKKESKEILDQLVAE